MKHTIYLTAAILGLVNLSWGEAPTGLAFLKIIPDVRSAGMGETGGFAGDELSGGSNPAAMAGIDQRVVAFSHLNWIQDVDLNYIQAAIPTKYLPVGFFVLSTGVDNIEVRTMPSPQPESYIDTKDLAMGLTLAKQIESRISVGVNLAYIHEHIYYEDTDGLSWDVGGMYRLSDNLRVGASVLHLGKMSAMLAQRPELPTTVNFGGEYCFKAEKAGVITVAAGGNIVRDEDMRGNLGVEWQPIALIALRAGYLFNYDDRGLTVGLGAVWKNFRFDYAFTPFGNELGDVQRFGVGVEF